LEHLQQARQEGRFSENLIQAELLDNPHRALLTVVPDPELEERQRQAELKRLAEIEASLTDEERERIVQEALRLKAEQEAKPDLSVLPTLDLGDIPMKFEDVPSRDENVRAARVEFYPQPTNGITYLDLRSDLVARLDIDPRRLKEIIAEISTRLESSLASLGFQFALLRAHSKLSSEGALNDRLQGIGMLHTMRRLARLKDTELGDVVAD